MCIIAVKAEGVKMPSDSIMRKMWRSNSDGAGFMVKRKRSKMVDLKKGFMTYNEFMEAIKKAKIKDSDIVVMHFRITSAGRTVPRLTHPFIGDVNQEVAEVLEAKTDQMCFAHNGTMTTYSKLGKEEDRSDTSMFASMIMSSQMVKDNIHDKLMGYFINNEIGSSRLAVINPEMHNVFIFGEWAESTRDYKWNKSDDGMMYSNHSWIPFSSPVYRGFGGDWYGSGEDYDRIGDRHSGTRVDYAYSDDDNEEDNDGLPFKEPISNLFGDASDKDAILHDFETLDLSYQESFLKYMELSKLEFVEKVNRGMTVQEYMEECVDWLNKIGVSDNSSSTYSVGQVMTEDGYKKLPSKGGK